MSGMTLFFVVVGVGALVTKFVDFVEIIGGDAHGRRKRHAAMR